MEVAEGVEGVEAVVAVVAAEDVVVKQGRKHCYILSIFGAFRVFFFSHIFGTFTTFLKSFHKFIYINNITEIVDIN